MSAFSEPESSQISAVAMDLDGWMEKAIPGLIDGQIAERIRHRVDSYTAAFPALLEIPSKDHPYDPEKDSVLKRVRRLFGE
jgi:ATP synthase F subunit